MAAEERRVDSWRNDIPIMRYEFQSGPMMDMADTINAKFNTDAFVNVMISRLQANNTY